MEHLAAQLERIKNQLMACQHPEDRQRLIIEFRQLEAEIRVSMDAARTRIQQTEQENANMRTATERFQHQREQ
jgi:hypothetical protein